MIMFFILKFDCYERYSLIATQNKVCSNYKLITMYVYVCNKYGKVICTYILRQVSLYFIVNYILILVAKQS